MLSLYPFFTFHKNHFPSPTFFQFSDPYLINFWVKLFFSLHLSHRPSPTKYFSEPYSKYYPTPTKYFFRLTLSVDCIV